MARRAPEAQNLPNRDKRHSRCSRGRKSSEAAQDQSNPRTPGESSELRSWVTIRTDCCPRTTKSGKVIMLQPRLSAQIGLAFSRALVLRFPCIRPTISIAPITRLPSQINASRSFSSTPISQSWLAPRRGHKGKSRKGRPRVRTGGSVKGTTVVWGDYGLRMCDHDRRIPAKNLQIGMDTIRKRLRGLKFRVYTRVAADRAVFTKGNEQRMGKGKGAFDYYASRVAVNHMIFELKGEVHEKVVRDAFRLAAAKMPGQYEFVKKGDPPVMGLTKLVEGMTLEDMKRPWLIKGASTASSRVPPTPNEPMEASAERLPATTPP